MPGIIAASWASDQRERVELVFHRACECYTMLKGLTCKSQAWRPGYSIARFPRSNSLCPDIYQTEDKRLIFAGAGWWFDPDAQQSKRPNLECLANRYRTEKEKVLLGLDLKAPAEA